MIVTCRVHMVHTYIYGVCTTDRHTYDLDYVRSLWCYVSNNERTAHQCRVTITGQIFMNLRRDHDLRLRPASSLVVVLKSWDFSQTEHRVAGTYRGGALLRGHYRLNFVKVALTTGRQRNARVGYVQLRSLMKIILDRRQGHGSVHQLARRLDGKRAFLCRWLEEVPGPTDATGALRLRWARPPDDHAVGTAGSELAAFWFQILEADAILEGVQLIPIPLDPAQVGADKVHDSPERTFYVLTRGKTASGET